MHDGDSSAPESIQYLGFMIQGFRCFPASSLAAAQLCINNCFCGLAKAVQQGRTDLGRL